MSDFEDCVRELRARFAGLKGADADARARRLENGRRFGAWMGRTATGNTGERPEWGNPAVVRGPAPRRCEQ